MRVVKTYKMLRTAIDSLKDDASDDYWAPTAGNAKIALEQLYFLAGMCPDGVWAVH
jgi:hypothetical protein